MKFFTYLKKLFSNDAEASSKRFVCIVLVIVQIVALFLTMYIKTEISNRQIVLELLQNMFWLCLIFGGFIAAEPVLQRLKLGGPKNVVYQDVDKQTVNTDQKKTEPLQE